MRQRILEATERVFREKGLAGATTREIARDAGCAEGTLYLHFEDRLALFSALLEECLPDVKEAFHQLPGLVGKRTVRGNLEGAALSFLLFQERAMGLLCSIFAEPELLRAHREKLERLGKGPQVAERVVADYVRAEQKLGRVNRKVSAESVASMILGACYYRIFARKYMGMPPLEEPQQFVRKTIDGLLRGLKGSAAASEPESANALMEIRSLHP